MRDGGGRAGVVSPGGHQARNESRALSGHEQLKGLRSTKGGGGGGGGAFPGCGRKQQREVQERWETAVFRGEYAARGQFRKKQRIGQCV